MYCSENCSVQFSRSVVPNSLWPHETQQARPPCPLPTPGVHQTHVHCVADTIQQSILYRPLLLLPLIFPSIRVSSNESALHIRWPEYWSFSFNFSPYTDHPGLISFRMDWLDVLAVQGLSTVFSNNTVQKHQFFSTQLSL